ncbi:MAG: hypothetical protein HON65_06985 [Rhodospirillales bacterium]|jgi:hypothetical protein|nr:hypothetical protein [Rhodospirillales bacterium]
MSYEIQYEDNGVYWRFYGDVIYNDLLAVNKDVWGSPKWGLLRYQIVDFLEAQAILISKEEAILIAHMDIASAKSTNEMRVACIADQQPIIEMCEVYKQTMTAEGWEVEIFNTLEAARGWIEEIH